MNELHIISQRCIGYQKYGHVELRAVIASQWSDGTTSYALQWEDKHGHICTEGVIEQGIPHISITAEEMEARIARHSTL